MIEYNLVEIRQNDWRLFNKLETLLRKEGIRRDNNLDYTVGLFDDDYNLLATGSCYKHTLRCLVVDSDHQGEGLLNEIVSYLEDIQISRGNRDLFLYTKCQTAKYFGDLNFHEITRVENKLVFMENIKGGFRKYLKNLSAETAAQLAAPAFDSFRKKAESPSPTGELHPVKTAAVVVNANPFTLGHQYLLEKAAADNDLVHVFVISEDASLVPFDVRYRLVLAGTEHIKNIVYHCTGDYMISNATFPSYFLKTDSVIIEVHAALDLDIFTRIAAELDIKRRYVSNEPFSKVTAIYNRSMEQRLPAAGIEFVEIPRRCDRGVPISASEVRALLKTERMEELKDKLPSSTYEFFLTDEGKQVIKLIQAAKVVRHY